MQSPISKLKNTHRYDILFLMTTSLFYLLSLFLSSPTLPHSPVPESHPRPGITNLKGMVLRLRTAGEELNRPTLFSASCCGPPPTLSFYHAFPLSVFLPSSIYHTLSECLGPRPQKQQVASCYRPGQAALIAFAMITTR